MIIIFAIDALEHELVEEFNCTNLKQEYYGKTNLADFSQPRTMVLWSSFITGQNKENEVLEDGNKEMWSKTWKKEETFFRNFSNPVVLDLPGYSYNLKVHEASRILLKQFFDEKDAEKKHSIRKQYNKEAFDHNKTIKGQFLSAVDSKQHDLVLGYFSVADVVGHLNFGNKTMMKLIYKEMDEMAEDLRKIHGVKLLILSDHGMKAIGMFGDHSEYGFWSTNMNLNLTTPKPTDFFEVIRVMKDGETDG